MAMTKKGKAWRNSLIRKAKTIQNQTLHMSDDEYQTMLSDRYGKTSTAHLSIDELKDLCSHLDILTGGSPQATKKAAPKVDPQAKMIWALWQELHEIGAVRDPSAKALNAFINNLRKITVESYTWLDRHQASQIGRAHV